MSGSGPRKAVERRKKKEGINMLMNKEIQFSTYWVAMVFYCYNICMQSPVQFRRLLWRSCQLPKEKTNRKK